MTEDVLDPVYLVPDHAGSRSAYGLRTLQDVLVWEGKMHPAVQSTSRGIIVWTQEKGVQTHTLFVRDGAGFRREKTETIGDDTSQVLLRGIAIVTPKKTSGLLATPPGDLAGAPQPLIPLPGKWGWHHACRTDRTATIILTSDRVSTFWHFDGKTWLPGQQTTFTPLQHGAGWPHVSCDDDGASAALQRGDKIELLRCTPAGCTATLSPTLPWLPPSSVMLGAGAVEMVGVGDRVLVVHREVDAPARRAVIRYRFARPAELLEAPQTLVELHDQADAEGWAVDVDPGSGGAVVKIARYREPITTSLVWFDREGKAKVIPRPR